MIGLIERQQFTISFKERVINEVLSGKLTKEQARRKYNIKGKSAILNWIRRLNLELTSISDNSFVKLNMSKQSFSPEELQKKIQELEAALEEANFKTQAYSTMIDVAEKELKIKIRKKSSTKPSKK